MRHEEGIRLQQANELLLKFWVAYLEGDLVLDLDLWSGLEEYQADWGEGWPTGEEVVQAMHEKEREHLRIVRIRPDGDERVMDTYENRTYAETDLLRYRNSGPPGWKYEIREAGS